jgi:hypothetical protein
MVRLLRRMIIYWMEIIYGEMYRVSRGEIYENLTTTMFNFETLIRRGAGDHDRLPKRMNQGFSGTVYIMGSTATPAGDKMCEVRLDQTRTNNSCLARLRHRQASHHDVAQLRFASTRMRKDIQTTIALFLTTWARAPVGASSRDRSSI